MYSYTATKKLKDNTTSNPIKKRGYNNARWRKKAQKILQKIKGYGQEIGYGEDNHTLVSVIRSRDELIF